MKEVLMMQGGMKLVEMCGAVSKGENVSIITDMITLKIAKVLAKEAFEKEKIEIAFPTQTILINQPHT